MTVRPSTLAALVVLAWIAVIAVVSFVAIPPENKEIVYTVVGATGAALTMVLSYYFGSSRGETNATRLGRDDKR